MPKSRSLRSGSSEASSGYSGVTTLQLCRKLVEVRNPVHGIGDFAEQTETVFAHVDVVHHHENLIEEAIDGGAELLGHQLESIRVAAFRRGVLNLVAHGGEPVRQLAFRARL